MIEKTISECVQLAIYISVPITLIYGTSGLSNFLSFLQGQNESFFTSSDQIIIRGLKECA